MANIDYHHGGMERDGGSGVQRLVNFSGALVSLVLIGGLAVWGYKLLVRDVTGVPVIQAMDGAFRIAPENPGGMTTPHQGLAVNEIAAEGSATGPVDVVQLAPAPADLSREDRPTADLVAEAQRRTDAAVPGTPPAGEASADAGIDPTARDRTTLPNVETVAESGIVIDDVPVDVSATDMAVAEALAGVIDDEPQSSTADGVPQDVMSPRPAPRPGAVTRVTPTPASARAVDLPARARELPAASIAPGTRLAQLGAYSSAEMARSEWNRIGGMFSDYFGGKRRVVQEITSGGRTFYRLRAEGFADLGEARRFCSALAAGNAECIPVEFR